MTTAPARPRLSGWPDLDRVPTGPKAALAARVARRIFRTAVSRLDITVHVEGETLGRGGPVATIHRPEEFFTRVGTDSLIGFGEAYLTGAWDSDDLAGFLTVLAAEVSTLVPQSLQRLRSLWVRRVPHTLRNTEDNSQDNIAHHYDLSNELFQLFLDETMTYSSALFDGLGGTPDLAAGQARKIERLLDLAGVTEGTRVLEIGTGWGELALRAARRGARVHTVTLSQEQQVLARQRIAAAGLSDRVDVDLRDYRSLVSTGSTDGRYDAVVSVEMIEAVGHEYLPTYFSTVDRLLAPGGRFALQAITMPHHRMLATLSTHTFITKYIFPGGFLPSVEAIDEVTRRHTRLRVTERFAFGAHYAETLRQWDARFLAAREQVRALGFDEIFERMWHFYLCYSRGGFASGYLDVNQVLLTRPEELG